MKVTASLLTAFALTDRANAESTPLRKTERNLQNNNYYQYNGYQNQGGQQGGYNYNGQQNGGGYNMYGGYENMEEYMRAQMAQRTFSFTGCSTVQGAYGYTTMATYRLCENCSNNKGCSNGNGDYVVNMQEFSESYREYYQEYTGMENSPFECMRVEEYQEKNYNYNNYQNYQNGNGNGNQQGNQQYYQNGQQQDAQQQYYGQQQQQQELYIGPACDGSSSGLSLGVFYNEWCTYPAEGVSVKDVLGYNPDSASMPTCIACSSSYNNNGEQEINPLCERLLEQSGRCDRDDSQETDFDSFWQDVVEFVNGGGTFYEDNYGDEYYADQQADGYGDNEDQDGYWYQGQQNYYGQQGNGGMDYYQYNAQNTCSVIDSLPHMKSSSSSGGGNWMRMKEEANSNGIGTGALITAILAGIAVACIAGFMLFGWFARKGVEAVGTAASYAVGESETPYKRESDKPSTTPAVMA